MHSLGYSITVAQDELDILLNIFFSIPQSTEQVQSLGPQAWEAGSPDDEVWDARDLYLGVPSKSSPPTL